MQSNASSKRLEDQFVAIVNNSSSKYQKFVKKIPTIPTDASNANFRYTYTLDNQYKIDDERDRLIKTTLKSNMYKEFNRNIEKMNNKKTFTRFLLFNQICDLDRDKEFANILRLGLSIAEATNRAEFINELRSQFLDFNLKEQHKIRVNLISNFKLDVSIDSILLFKNDEIHIIVNKKQAHVGVSIELRDKKRFDMKYDEKRDPMVVIEKVMGIFRVYFGSNIKYQISNVDYLEGCPRLNIPINVISSSSSDVKISKNELPKFKTFFKHVFLSDPYIQRSIEKFSLSCNKVSAVDELMYLVLSWEALLGKSEHRDSIGFRISHRIIRLLTHSFQIRKDLHQKMSKFYDARSSYVHGNKLGSSFNLCLHNIKYYKELIRLSIITFITEMANKNLNYQEMLNKLDYDKLTKNEVRIKIQWQDAISSP